MQRFHVHTKVFACTHWNEYLVLTSVSTRTYESVYLVLTEVFACTYWNEYVVFILLLLKSPNGAILLHSPGRKPWVNHWNTFIEPRRGGTNHNAKLILALLVPLLRSSSFFSVYTQGYISGFALIPPWALQECRAYGTHNVPEFWCNCFFSAFNLMASLCTE